MIFFYIIAFSVSLPAEQSIALTLKTGTTLNGNRLTFEDGQFQLFQADIVVPTSVDFVDVQTVSVSHPQKKKQPKQFRLPPFIRPLTKDKFNELEKVLLAGEDIPTPFRGSKDRVNQSRLNLMRMAQIANYHIEQNQLDSAVRKYAKSIKRKDQASTADERAWLLYLICLERLDDNNSLHKEVAAFKARYGDRIPVSRFFEKANAGEIGGGRRPMRPD